MADLFLTDDELCRLTGRKIKSKQIEWLRGEGLPFRVSATGHPVVTKAAIDGRSAPQAPAPAWRPRVVGVT